MESTPSSPQKLVSPVMPDTFSADSTSACRRFLASSLPASLASLAIIPLSIRRISLAARRVVPPHLWRDVICLATLCGSRHEGVVDVGKYGFQTIFEDHVIFRRRRKEAHRGEHEDVRHDTARDVVLWRKFLKDPQPEGLRDRCLGTGADDAVACVKTTGWWPDRRG